MSKFINWLWEKIYYPLYVRIFDKCPPSCPYCELDRVNDEYFREEVE